MPSKTKSYRKKRSEVPMLDMKPTEIRNKIKSYYQTYSNAIQIGIDHRTFVWGEQFNDDQLDVFRKNKVAPLQNNVLIKHLRSVVGEFGSNIPSITLRPKSVDVDPKEVSCYEDIINAFISDETISAEITDAYEDGITTGCSGAIYVYTEYEDDYSFNQKICARRLDFTSVFFDPAAKLSSRSDGRYCGYFTSMSREDFEERYPDSSASSDLTDPFLETTEILPVFYRKNANEDESVRLAHFFEKIDSPKTIYLTDEGRTIMSEDELELGETIIKSRKSKCTQIRSFLTDGRIILEEKLFPFSRLPIICFTGQQKVINGVVTPFGFGWEVRDPQRFLNLLFSQSGDWLLNMRKETFVLNEESLGGEASQKRWANPMATQGALTYQKWAQGKENDKPQVIPPPQLSPTVLSLLSGTQETIDSTLGRYEDVQGASGADVSGIARGMSIAQNNIGASYSLQNTGEQPISDLGKLFCEIIPQIHCTPSVLSLETGNIMINMGESQDSEARHVDMSKFKESYKDLRIGVSSSFEAQRAQRAQNLQNLLQNLPPDAQILFFPYLAPLLDLPNISKLNETLSNYLQATNPVMAAVYKGDSGGALAAQQAQQMQRMSQMQEQQQAIATQAAQQKIALQEREMAIKEEQNQIAKQKAMLDQAQAMAKHQIDQEQIDLKRDQMNLEAGTATGRNWAEIAKAQLSASSKNSATYPSPQYT